MSYLWLGLGLLIGLALGGLVGFKIGSAWKRFGFRFWAFVVALFAAAVVSIAYGIRSETMLVTGVALGGLTGGLTGLKYGGDEDLKRLLSRSAR